MIIEALRKYYQYNKKSALSVIMEMLWKYCGGNIMEMLWKSWKYYGNVMEMLFVKQRKVCT